MVDCGPRTCRTLCRGGNCWKCLTVCVQVVWMAWCRRGLAIHVVSQAWNASRGSFRAGSLVLARRSSSVVRHLPRNGGAMASASRRRGREAALCGEPCSEVVPLRDSGDAYDLAVHVLVPSCSLCGGLACMSRSAAEVHT
eukprot:4037914-Pyramimonas_sp.AAC.1